jgi:hypothetical protein
LASYSARRAAVAIWTQARVTPWPTSSRRGSPSWTSASHPDAGLDTWDRHGTTAGDVLDAPGNLLTGDKFGLSVVLILSVSAKFTV